MPSGSHGGSAGSHHTSGSHSTSVSRTNRIHRGVRSGIFIFGRGGSKKASFAKFFSIFLTVVASIILMVAIALVVSGCSDMENIEADYAYYQQLFQNADAHPELVVEGQISGKFYNRDCKKWYFTYQIPLSSGLGKLDGYTYSVFSVEEIAQFNVADIIFIAVDALPITQNTDSMPVVCRDITFRQDGEWLSANGQKITSIWLFSAAGLIVLIVISICTVSALKTKKVQSAPVAEKKNATPLPQKKQQEPKTYKQCPNCGGEVATHQAACPICGTKLKKIK